MPEEKVWYVWRTGCYVDPFRIWTASKYPTVDADGYYRGMAMPACMSVPVGIRAATRSQAISTFKYALSLYEDYKRGKALQNG